MPDKQNRSIGDLLAELVNETGLLNSAGNRPRKSRSCSGGDPRWPEHRVSGTGGCGNLCSAFGVAGGDHYPAGKRNAVVGSGPCSGPRGRHCGGGIDLEGRSDFEEDGTRAPADSRDIKGGCTMGETTNEVGRVSE